MLWFLQLEGFTDDACSLVLSHEARSDSGLVGSGLDINLGQDLWTLNIFVIRYVVFILRFPALVHSGTTSLSESFSLTEGLLSSSMSSMSSCGYSS